MSDRFVVSLGILAFGSGLAALLWLVVQTANDGTPVPPQLQAGPWIRLCPSSKGHARCRLRAERSVSGPPGAYLV